MWKEGGAARKKLGKKQIGGGKRKRGGSVGKSGGRKSGERLKACKKESVISCKVRLQGENKMREAYFNLQSFWSKTKPTDHTALTAGPKLQFTFHFLNKYTQCGFRQILFFSFCIVLLIHKYFVFFRGKN